MELWISLIAGACGGSLRADYSNASSPGPWLGACLGGIGGSVIALALSAAGVSPMRDGGTDVISLGGQSLISGVCGLLVVSAAIRLKSARKR